MGRIERFKELVKAGISPKQAENIIKQETRTASELRKEQAKLSVSLSQSRARLNTEQTRQKALKEIAASKAEIKKIKSERFKGSFLGRTAAATRSGITSAARNTQKFSKSREGRSIGRIIMGRTKSSRRKKKSSGDGFFGGGSDSGGFF